MKTQGLILPVNVRAVICDAPAKAFVKGIKQFNAYYGCDRCDQPGNHVNGRHVFLETENLTLQSNQSFRERQQPEHHRCFTPFLDLNIDMINHFPMDYMHTCCIGIMKKLLLLWMKGDRTQRVSRHQIQ